MENIELIPILFWIVVVAISGPIVIRAFISMKPCKGFGPAKRFLAPITPNEKRMALKIEEAKIHGYGCGGFGSY